ncbi:glycosyl transferase group 1 [Brevibacterium linens]|uniref:Glycosyl transferase group 1 n=2 Tax=Brevibacterium linens TaxID=1703 RepID=A0A0B9A4W3_BRELN|nr:glycosyl transferase group 1 [Brevibacterium linens]
MGNEADRLGGVGRFMNEMAMGFYRRGYACEIVGIAPAPEGHLQSYTRPVEIAVRTMMPDHAPAEWNIRNDADRKDRRRVARYRRRMELRRIAVERLRHLLKEWGPSTLIICTQVFAMEHMVEAGYDANDFNMPRVVGQYHGSFYGAKLTGKDVRRVTESYRNVDKTVFLTEEDATLFRKQGLNNTFWIPNPVSAPDSQNTVRRNTFFALGRYDEEKGLHFLLSAWESIAGLIPDWNLELYGEGELRPQLQRMIDDNSIPRADLMGKTDRVGDVIASSKVHVLSSVHEGLPIAIVEAGLLGAPTVAFDCAPGIRELIESGRNGIVVPLQNIKILAEEMLRLARDESLLSTLSRHCAEDMQRYSPSAIVDRWENLFVEMSR